MMNHDKINERAPERMLIKRRNTIQMLEKKTQLSDETKISGTNWGELKENAMVPNYMEKSVFVSFHLEYNFLLVPVPDKKSKRDSSRSHKSIESSRQHGSSTTIKCYACTQTHETNHC